MTLTLALAPLFVVVPAALAFGLPAAERRFTRMLEALGLCACLALTAQGLFSDRVARAIAVSVLLYIGLRVGRSAAASDPAPDPSGLLATGAFAICALVEPTGPRALLAGTGLLFVAHACMAFERRPAALVVGLVVTSLGLLRLFA